MQVNKNHTYAFPKKINTETKIENNPDKIDKIADFLFLIYT